MGLVETKKTGIEKPLLWVGVAIVVLSLITLSVVLVLKMNQKEAGLIATVGETKIYEADLNESIYGLGFVGSLTSPQETSNEVKQQLLDEIVEREILEKKAQELGISVAEERVEAYAKEININYNDLTSSQKDIVKKNAKLILLRSAVKEKVLTWSQGKVLFYRFYLHYYDAPSDKSEAERKTLAVSDKEYAKNKIDELYGLISSGQVTFEQAMETVKNDKTLGNPAWQPYTMIFATEFSKEDSFDQLFPNNAPNFWKQVADVEKSTVSVPLTVEIKLNEDTIMGKEKDIVEGMYMLVKKEDGNKGEASSYEEWLQKEKDKLGVKTYL